MNDLSQDWQRRIVSPDKVLDKIEPGMSIYIGTGVSEPRTIVKQLKKSPAGNLTDLELVQLVSLGDAVSYHTRPNRPKYRLKTFFSGWRASEAITTGAADFIPARLSRIPGLVESGAIRIDAVFVQISRPDASGYASLGVAIDVAKYAMEKATLIVGEINDDVPRTHGNTFVHVRDFHYFIEATEPMITLPRWPVDDLTDKVAANVAELVEDGSCLFFFSGTFFEALGKHLMHKRDLGIHTLMFTDPVMDLIKAGAVTNRKKGHFRGKSLTSYAQGTPELMRWLDNNPLVEFQGIDIVTDHLRIGLNDRMTAILPARKVGLTGDIILPAGRGNVVASPGQAEELVTGTMHSAGGKTIFALRSRNREGKSNILLSVDEYPNQFTNREAVDLIVTEFGIASLVGRSIRERAQALIDIAHPEDREALVRQAKEAHILYEDQIYLVESGCLYPEKSNRIHIFPGGLKVRFRAIKPSDEEQMRRLFYRFSDDTVYYRYFSPIKAMPHSAMQAYVNVDFRHCMSIVGIVEENELEKIVAEGRYVRLADRTSYADTAFVVDEQYQGKGIATYLFEMLMEMAQEQGLEGFTADVLSENKSMLKVFEKTGLALRAELEGGVYHLTMPFARQGGHAGNSAEGRGGGEHTTGDRSCSGMTDR